MFEIEFSDEAIADLKWFKKRAQNEILDGINTHLRYQPSVETRQRKRLRPNQTAEWELRIDNYRVFYDVETAVSIAAIGLKVGDLLRFRGKVREL